MHTGVDIASVPASGLEVQQQNGIGRRPHASLHSRMLLADAARHDKHCLGASPECAESQALLHDIPGYYYIIIWAQIIKI
jgi:hypothetical protein